MKYLLSHLLIFICCMQLSTVSAQTQEVKGRVVDESNKGIEGVSVINAANNRALTKTNESGNFTIRVAPSTSLIFKSVGFKDRTATVRVNQTELNIQLSNMENDVEEVVIRGYVARSKETTTGASTLLTEKDIRDRPTANLENLLQGLVPGLNVQINTGAPGFRGSTQIRGLSTLSMTGDGAQSQLMPTSPLYVIDGVPLDADQADEMGLQSFGPAISPLSLIPPEDVESIEILKDAQATALYGSQGAYGVIIIKTKRGGSEIPRINYVNQTFLKTPPMLRQTLGGNLERNLKIAQIIRFAQTQGEIDRITQTPWLADSLNAYYNNSTNWQDLFYQTTLNQNHNLSLSGGTPVLSYKSNIGYYGENGVIKNTGFERYSTNLLLQYTPDAKLSFMGQVFAQIGKRKVGDGTGIFQSGVASGGESSTLLPPPGFYTASSDYVASIRTRNNNSRKLIRPNFEVKYMVIPGLNLVSMLSYEFSSDNEDTFSPAASSGQFSRVFSMAGRRSQLYNRNGVNYSKTLGESHSLFFNLFNEVRRVDQQFMRTRQDRTPNDQFEGPLGYDGHNSRGGGVHNFVDERQLNFAVAASYNYKMRYNIDLSYRMDGASVNGFDDQYTKNPSIGLRWNMHRESWIQHLPWINLASLRMSWGVNVMPNSTLERVYGKYDINGNYNFMPGIGINFDQIPNPGLKPTTATQYNLGVEFAFLNNRIDLVYDTYYKSVDNLGFDELLNTTIGFNRRYANGAAIVNYGHEMAVNVRPLPASSKVMWTFSVNGALNRDVLAKLPDQYGGQYIRRGNDGQHTIFRVGASTLSNYILINNGVYSTYADVPVDPVTGIKYRASDGTVFREGDPIWVDQNGDYILDDKDYVRTGNAMPLVTGGLQNSVSYKNFELTINASYTAVRTIFNGALARRLGLMSDPYGRSVVVPLDDIDMWRKDGDIAKYPNAYDFSRYGSIRPFRNDQSLWAEDGSYLKINAMTFAYNVSQETLRRFRLTRFRVYVNLDNVVTFSKYSGPNPENVSSMGFDLSDGYPVPRTYTLGLNLSF